MNIIKFFPLGPVLTQLRKDKQLALCWVADAADIDVVTLHRLEKSQGKGVTLEVVLRVCYALGFTPSEVFALAEEQAPKVPIPLAQERMGSTHHSFVRNGRTGYCCKYSPQDDQTIRRSWAETEDKPLKARIAAIRAELPSRSRQSIYARLARLGLWLCASTQHLHKPE